MKVFLSWSGGQSRHVARALHSWLPLVLHYVEPWMSEKDIGAGDRWAVELGKILEESSFGIICVTPENLHSDWMLFEAGALSKSLAQSSVVPYLVRVDLSDLQGPLTQFQAKKADKQATLEVLQRIDANSKPPIGNERLGLLFEPLWPVLEQQLKAIPTAEVPEPARPQNEVVEDLIATVRTLAERMRSMEKGILTKLDELELESGDKKDETGGKLDAIKDIIREAELLVGGVDPGVEEVKRAVVLASEAKRMVKTLFATQILPPTARVLAKRLSGRAEAVLAITREEQGGNASTGEN